MTRPRAERSQPGAHEQRHKEQKPGGDHETEGSKAIEQKRADVHRWPRLHPPDGVQRGLELQKGAHRRENEGDGSDRRGHPASATPAGAFEESLHRECAVVTNQRLDFVDHLTAHRIGSEDVACNRNRHQEHRRD